MKFTIIVQFYTRKIKYDTCVSYITHKNYPKEVMSGHATFRASPSCPYTQTHNMEYIVKFNVYIHNK